MVSETARVPSGDVTLTGDLVVPAEPRGTVLSARGSGISRVSPWLRCQRCRA
ncbi:hypothetical protein J2S54_006771 [Streptomyces sp. DSM 42143]|nr:hypothetical protein [Streptomyces sp. DSM 42143]